MTISREISLPKELSSVTVGRHFVRDCLLAWDRPALVEDAELGTSELVANAVRHAGTDLVLKISNTDEVVISVADRSQEMHAPLLSDGGALAERGRGLHIVAAISLDWGIRALPGGKEIWFSLRQPDHGRADATVFQISSRRDAKQSGGPPASPGGSGSVEGPTESVK